MRTTPWTVSLATALLVGCGPTRQPAPGDPTDQHTPPVVEPTADPAPADPVAIPADPAPANPAASDPAAQQALLQQKCTQCHGLDKVDEQRTDRAGWTAIVDRMIEAGATLTDAERTDLIDYLATRTPS